MADVTGLAYEALTHFLLKLWIERQPSKIKKSLECHFEKKFEPYCHNECLHGSECRDLSKSASLPYGPWNDPDFVVTKDLSPLACVHVTHWTSPSDSPRKFWRSVEDHFQWKILYGKKLRSISFLFEALHKGSLPRTIKDHNTPIDLHGWKRGIGNLFLVSFDASVVFPLNYDPLIKYLMLAKNVNAKNADEKKAIGYEIWNNIYQSDEALRSSIESAVDALSEALSGETSKAISNSTISTLRDTCFIGRKRAIQIKGSSSRYRKGIQHLFILEEVCKRFCRFEGSLVSSLIDLISLGKIVPKKKFFSIFQNLGISESQIDLLLIQLGEVPVKIDKRKAIFLIDPAAGLGRLKFNDDLEAFGVSLGSFSKVELGKFKSTIDSLFIQYRKVRGVSESLEDLSDRMRVSEKIAFAMEWVRSASSLESFLRILSEEIPLLNKKPSHQRHVSENGFWLIDVLISLYDIKRKQDLVARIGSMFEAKTGEPLRNYGFRGDVDQMLNFVLQGGDLTHYFPKSAALDQHGFLNVIWRLLGTLFWEKIANGKPRNSDLAQLDYKYRRARRIISQSDLEPNVYLLKIALPKLNKIKPQGGCFTELGAKRGYGKNLLTTQVVGRDPKNCAIIHSQSVVGNKHIWDKVRELSLRMRSLNLELNSDNVFCAKKKLEDHIAVLDGDWPIEAKINLLEAGFSKVVEIAEL
jgi:hypothetical protein